MLHQLCSQPTASVMWFACKHVLLSTFSSSFLLFRPFHHPRHQVSLVLQPSSSFAHPEHYPFLCVAQRLLDTDSCCNPWPEYLWMTTSFRPFITPIPLPAQAAPQTQPPILPLRRPPLWLILARIPIHLTRPTLWALFINPRP